MPITAAEIENQLAKVSNLLPISHAARDVYCMAAANKYSAQQLAAAAARDPALIAELLRMANSIHYNPSGQRIAALEQAVARIGQKRVGELALAASMATALTRTLLPWMDLKLMWRRSLAAGVAVELLVAAGGHHAHDEGLLLCAIMHSLGRVVLASVYGQQYQEMIEECRSTGESLLDRERLVFGESHAQVMGRLLTTWKIPADVSRPLTHVVDDYIALAQLEEPIRTKAELLKISILMGQIAVGQWESWDRIELPPAGVIKRLNIGRPGPIVEQTRSDSQALIDFQAQSLHGGRSAPNVPISAPAAKLEIAYAHLAEEPFDFFGEILMTLGFELAEPPEDISQLRQSVVMNCLGIVPSRLSPRIVPQLRGRVAFVTDHPDADSFRACGSIIPLPISLAALQQACTALAAPHVAPV